MCYGGGKGKYNFTSNGELIAHVGEFTSRKTTFFDIPYSQSPSTILPTSQDHLYFISPFESQSQIIFPFLLLK